MVRHGYLLFVCFLCVGRPVLADDEALAREQFDAGVAATEDGRWEDAARYFEASLARSDRAATRFNLTLAYGELGRPLEVVRHALAFLDEANAPGREEARVRAAALLMEARRQLAVLSVSALPVGSQLQVDGHSPSLVHEGDLYLLPGAHHLELRLGPNLHETIEISLSAGQVMPWPRLGRAAPDQATPVEPPATPAGTAVASESTSTGADWSSLARARTRAAWALGSVGGALAVAAGACLLVTDRRADELRSRGIPGTQQPGYFDDLERYWNSFNAVMPLAFTGGALMASAILVGGRIAGRGSWTLSIASLATGAALIGFGTYWLIRDPSSVIPTTSIDRPSRPGGSMLFSAGLPLLTYGLAFAVAATRRVQLSADFSALRLVW